MPLHIASNSSTSNYAPPLLFQFILSHFLATMPQVFRLEKLLEKLENSSLQESEGHVLQEISEIVRSLLGLKKDDKHVASWEFAKGPLTQMRRHCYTLYHSFGSERSRVRPLLTYVKKSWFYSLQTHDLICTYSLTAPNAAREIAMARTNCLNTLKKALRHLHNLKKSMPNLFYHFGDDENVIFFLWRHQKEFNAICGENFAETLLEKMFPVGGIEAVRQMLIQRYSEREFHQLIPLISEGFPELIFS